MSNKRLLTILLFILILIPVYSYAAEIPTLGSKAIYIAEPSTGKVIYEKNAYEKMFPASTTKILTALVVMENCDLNEKAIVSQNAIDLVPDGYSKASIRVGEELDVKTLLYALLIPSANEAANVLAEHVSGSVDSFVELCNKRAQELGCETLHFTNTNGIHDENHYCSAYDLYLIAKECKKYDIFNEIVKTKSFTMPATNVYSKEDRTFKNTNELLLSGKYYYENCTGIKTGHTTPAGECLVGSAYNNSIELISVVLGGSSSNSKGLNERFADTKELYDYTYNNYSIKEIATSGDTIVRINVGKATKDTKDVEAIVDKSISTIVPNEINKEDVLVNVELNQDIVAPIDKNQVLGTITYDADGLIFKTNLIASHPVEKLPYEKYNVLVTAVIIITIIFFARLLRHKKINKKRVLTFGVIVAIFEIVCGVLIIKEGAENSITTSTIVYNIAQIEQSSGDYIEGSLK